MPEKAATSPRDASTGAAFEALVGIVERLRGPGGCPWDQAQTPASVRPYVLEEAYEVLDAIDGGCPAALRKELGDLLFQVVLLAQMAREDDAYDIRDVLGDIADKMVRRHPHVFDADHAVQGDEGEIASWEARKAKEREGRSALDGVPRALPALLRAHRVSEKASQVGFDWPDVAGVRAKLDEEVAELDQALASGDPGAIEEELGDVLFTLVNLGRFLPTPAEDALRAATDRFAGRFQALEAHLAAQGRSVHDTPPDALEEVWRAMKTRMS